MNRYYYHGFEAYYGTYGSSVETMIKILIDGLKTRSEVRNLGDSRYNHICLYKKNENYDYSDKNVFLKSARSGWIDSGFVFIISPDVEAEKVEISNITGFDNEGRPYSDLIDEWRSIGNIPPSQIVGIALPYNSIKEYLNDETIDYDEEDAIDKRKLIELLPLLEEYASKMNLLIMNSEVPNFTDELDESLNTSITK